jgi:hypothetical protein
MCHIRRACVLWLGLMAALAGNAASVEPARVALVRADAEVPEFVVPLMEAALSDTQAQWLEREQIDTALGEIKLAAALGDAGQMLAFDQVIPADAILAVGTGVAGQHKTLDFKLIDTNSGVVLDQLRSDLETAFEQQDMLKGWLHRAAATAGLPRTARSFVAVEPLVPEEPSLALIDMADALTFLLRERLAQRPGVVVLEREFLEQIRLDRRLRVKAPELMRSSVVLSGSIATQRSTFGLVLTCERPGGGGRYVLRLGGADASALWDAAEPQIARRLKLAETEATATSAEEAGAVALEIRAAGSGLSEDYRGVADRPEQRDALGCGRAVAGALFRSRPDGLAHSDQTIPRGGAGMDAAEYRSAGRGNERTDHAATDKVARSPQDHPRVAEPDRRTH